MSQGSGFGRRRVAAVFASISLISTLGAAGSADAALRRCRSPLAVTGAIAPLREAAEASALAAWAKEAGKIGAGFKTWDQALSKDLTCMPTQPTGFICTANASPCALVGRG
jgi:hypothetical protein